MAIIEWNQNYSVGISKLDAQHQQLFSLINELFESTETKWNSKTVLRAMKSMKEYSLFHFDTEEEYMSKCGYPDLENHKKAHDQFRAKIDELCLEQEMQSPIIFTNIVNYLYTWLTNHIIVMDKQYQPSVCSHQT